MMKTVLVYALFGLSLAACDHDETKSESVAYEHNYPWGLVNGSDPVSAAVASIAVLFQLSAITSGSGASSNKNVLGSCKIITERSEQPCHQVHVQFLALPANQDTEVWVDSLGEFVFTPLMGQRYRVTAFSETLQINSKPVMVTGPGRIFVRIDIRAENAK